MKKFILSLVGMLSSVGMSVDVLASPVPAGPDMVNLSEYLKVVQEQGNPVSIQSLELRDLELSSIKSSFMAAIVKNMNEVKQSNLAIERLEIENKALREEKKVEAAPAVATPTFQGGNGFMPFNEPWKGRSGSDDEKSAAPAGATVVVREISGKHARVAINGVSYEAHTGLEVEGVKVLSIGSDRVTVRENGKTRTVLVASTAARQMPAVKAIAGKSQ